LKSSTDTNISQSARSRSQDSVCTFPADLPVRLLF